VVFIVPFQGSIITNYCGMVVLEPLSCTPWSQLEKNSGIHLRAANSQKGLSEAVKTSTTMCAEQIFQDRHKYNVL
jgi:hypothetical protein